MTTPDQPSGDFESFEQAFRAHTSRMEEAQVALEAYDIEHAAVAVRVDDALQQKGIDLDGLLRAIDKWVHAAPELVLETMKALDISQKAAAALVRQTGLDMQEEVDTMRQLRDEIADSLLELQHHDDASDDTEEDDDFLAAKRDAGVQMFFVEQNPFDVGPWIEVYDTLTGGRPLVSLIEEAWLAQRLRHYDEASADRKRRSECSRAMRSALLNMGYPDNTELDAFIAATMHNINQTAEYLGGILGITVDDKAVITGIMTVFYPTTQNP